VTQDRALPTGLFFGAKRRHDVVGERAAQNGRGNGRTMLASISWLGEYIDLDGLTPQETASKLTMAGLEVEELRDRLAYLDDVLVAKVVAARPQGERLRALTVEAGPAGTLEVFCGDPLVEVGGLHPLALPGAALPAGPVKEKSFGDQMSRGVLCSAAELGLSAEAHRVMALKPGTAVGSTLRAYVDRVDWVMEISVTPNRSDALCMVGLARDLSAVLGRPLKMPQAGLQESEREAAGQIAVDIEAPDLCWRYAGRVVNDVAPGPSPDWLVERLVSAGLRSVSDIVDVTNYVMLELGQPLHAFDLKKLAGPRIVVKSYAAGEKFTTLDGQERILKAERNVMICDAERPVALGGVMGGLNTEVDESTRDVFLEAACFNPAAIRRTSRSLGLSTDASYRFERGQDPNGPLLAVDRAAALLAELAGGRAARGRLDRLPRPVAKKIVSFSPGRCNALSGAAHRADEMVKVLQAVGVELEPQGPDEYRAALPTWRPDLTREVDLFEEVVRLLDFENLPVTLPRPPAPAAPPPPAFRLRERLRDELTAAGFDEHLSYSFINSAFADKLLLGPDHRWRRDLTPILNPLSEDHGVLRPSLIPGLLTALRLNQYYGRWDVALFEAGAVFLADAGSQDGRPREPQRLGGLLAGSLGAGLWCDPKRPADFWDLKGVVEALAEALGLTLTFGRRDGELPPFYDPAAAALTLVDGRLVGHLGRLSREAAKAWGLRSAGGAVHLFELDLDQLQPDVRKPFASWSNYPGVTRDLAVLVDRTLPAAELVEAVSSRPEWPLAEVKVFDLYQGDKVPAGKKSLALRLFFQQPDRNLTDEEVNCYFAAAMSVLASQFDAELRS
jgi:phenylalanyl-tRNA synthetase beta chain